jgi:hypothetical protein
MTHQEIDALIDDELAPAPEQEPTTPLEIVISISSAAPAPQLRWLVSGAMAALALAALYLVVR